MAKSVRNFSGILDGMCGEFYTKAVQKALGAKVATVNVSRKPGLFDQVASVLCEAKRFTSCIPLGLGSEDDHAWRETDRLSKRRESVVRVNPHKSNEG